MRNQEANLWKNIARIRRQSRFLEMVVILFSVLIWILHTITYSHASYKSNNIIAIVNDDVISQYDVENRLDFLIKKFHLSQAQAVRRHLLPQVLQSLVDEHLKVQEATFLRFYIDNSEISRIISTFFEKQNPLPNRQSLSAFTDFFEDSLLSSETDSGVTGHLHTPDSAPITLSTGLTTDFGPAGPLRTFHSVPLSPARDSLLATHSSSIDSFSIGSLRTSDSVPMFFASRELATGSGPTGSLRTPDAVPMSVSRNSLLAIGSVPAGSLRTSHSVPLSASRVSVGLTGHSRTPDYVTEGFFLAQDPLNDYNNQEIGLFKDHLFIEILINEIRSEIAWHKIAQHTVHSHLGDSEVSTALQELHNRENKIQNLLAEIVLPVDNNTDWELIRLLAEDIVGQVRTGADFKAAARQFSQATSATHGGDLGWVLQGQLAFAMETVLQKMQPGQLSMPIRNLSGYTIILLRERLAACSADNTFLSLRQLFIPLTGPEALSPQKRSELLEAAQMASSCESFDALIQQTGTPESGQIGQIRAGDLLPTFRAALLQLSPQTASAPVPMNGGLAILMVCDRNSPAQQPALPSRETITQQLERSKIEALLYEKLHTLRRAAFIEVRSQ